MIVIDASALVHLLGGSDLGLRIADRIRDEPLHAPHLVDLEVAQAVRRMLRRDEIGEELASKMLRALVDFDLQRYPHGELLGLIWAHRHNLSAYDAAYVSLAEVLDCPLLTCDGRLARALGSGARVELFG